MVSKVLICFVLLAAVALCHCMPHNDWEDRQQQPRNKNLRVQDTSSSDSDEQNTREIRIRMSQEEDSSNSQEIKQAPKHQPMYQSRNGPEYMRGQQPRVNIQKSRGGNEYVDSNENNSQADRNKIY